MEVGGALEDTFENVWVEINSRTVGFADYREGHEFDIAATARLKALWSDWWQGRPLDPLLAQQFAAIRKHSQKTLKEVYGKPRRFTKDEFEQLAAEWHEALKRAGFWDSILPSPKLRELTGLTGIFGVGWNT